jgi:hypothetical protein
MDDSRQMYCERAFYFTGQGDYLRNDRVFLNRCRTIKRSR